MNRSRWSVVTVIAVGLLMLASSSKAVPDATAYPLESMPEIINATATINGDYVTISGTVDGTSPIQIEETNSHYSTYADGNGNFTMTFDSHGAFIFYVSASDVNGYSTSYPLDAE